MLTAAKEGDVKKVEQLLKGTPKAGIFSKALPPVDVNLTNDRGISALLQAACHGQLAMAEFLIGRGASISLGSITNYTPLMGACANGHTAIAKLLFAHKADPNPKMADGSTALYFAACNNNLEGIKLLLQHGADMHLKTFQGKTALEWSRQWGYGSVVALLESAAASNATSDQETKEQKERLERAPPLAEQAGTAAAARKDMWDEEESRRGTLSALGWKLRPGLLTSSWSECDIQLEGLQLRYLYHSPGFAGLAVSLATVNQYFRVRRVGRPERMEND